jgi:cytochrome c oxidase subunit 1
VSQSLRSGLLSSVDPARTGRWLLGLSLAGFVLGGLEALALRAQLLHADATLMAAATYHQVLTLHGVSMVFLCVLPAAMGMFLLLVPVRLGDGRTAYPRLSAFGAKLWACGALLLHIGLALGGTAGAGMLGNASLTALAWAPRERVQRAFLVFRANGVDWWATGLALVALGAACVALEIVTTVLTRRARDGSPGSTSPLAWNSLIAGVLGLCAFPALFVGLVLLQCDRLLGNELFVPESGADPSLWPRLTALLGHPQVVLLLLPAMGLVTEVIVSSAGRPLHRGAVVRAAGLVLGVTGALSWASQLTPTGAEVTQSLLPVAGALMALAAGTAVFHWLATLWGRPVAARPALSFALGMAALLMTGAFSTLPLALQPAAARQVGTYFGVAHAHEMLFGGVVLGLFAGVYEHGARLFGRALDPRLGQLHFALTLVGAFATFLPMHALGLAGMPRRVHTYPAAMGWGGLNALSTWGAALLALAGLVFALALVRARPVAPWGATVLEAPALPRTPGPALAAGGLALMAAGTLLGWEVGLAGGGLFVLGAWRSASDRRA